MVFAVPGVQSTPRVKMMFAQLLTTDIRALRVIMVSILIMSRIESWCWICWSEEERSWYCNIQVVFVKVVIRFDF